MCGKNCCLLWDVGMVECPLIPLLDSGLSQPGPRGREGGVKNRRSHHPPSLSLETHTWHTPVPLKLPSVHFHTIVRVKIKLQLLTGQTLRGYNKTPAPGGHQVPTWFLMGFKDDTNSQRAKVMSTVWRWYCFFSHSFQRVWELYYGCITNIFLAFMISISRMKKARHHHPLPMALWDSDSHEKPHNPPAVQAVSGTRMFATVNMSLFMRLWVWCPPHPYKHPDTTVISPQHWQQVPLCFTFGSWDKLSVSLSILSQPNNREAMQPLFCLCLCSCIVMLLYLSAQPNSQLAQARCPSIH